MSEYTLDTSFLLIVSQIVNDIKQMSRLKELIIQNFPLKHFHNVKTQAKLLPEGAPVYERRIYISQNNQNEPATS